jgi:hypothetical protein
MRGIWPEGMVLKNVDTSNGDRRDRGHFRPELGSVGRWSL